MKHWLFKSEPSDFSLQDLKDTPEQTECWDGVRNYQARNLMRDEMKLGDRVLFYHSNLNPSVVGTVTVVRESYPDHTSWDPDCKHFDPKSTPTDAILSQLCPTLQIDQQKNATQIVTLMFYQSKANA